MAELDAYIGRIIKDASVDYQKLDAYKGYVKNNASTKKIENDAWVTKTIPHNIIKDSLYFHIDATKGIIKDSNDKVSQWNDLSGEDHHVSQGTSAAQPVWVDDAINGLPAIRFDNAQWLGHTGFDLEQPCTVFAVVQVLDTNQGHNGIFTNQGSFWGLGKQARNNGHWETYAGVHLNGNNGQATWDNNVNLLCSIFNETDSAFYLNGEFDVDGNVGDRGIDDLSIGAFRPLDQNRFMDGYIAEILCYTEVLSSEEREKVEQYLGEKWLDWESDIIYDGKKLDAYTNFVKLNAKIDYILNSGNVDKIKDDAWVSDRIPIPFPDADGYIYNEGEHEDKWEGYYVSETYSPTYSKEDDHLFIEGPAAFVTNDLINLNNIDEIEIEYITSDSIFNNYLLITDSEDKYGNANEYEYRGTTTSSTEKTTMSFNIPSLTGNFHIKIMGTAGEKGVSSIEVYKIKLLTN